MVDLGCVQIPQYLGSCDVFPKLHGGPKNVEILHIFGPPYSHARTRQNIAILKKLVHHGRLLYTYANFDELWPTNPWDLGVGLQFSLKIAVFSSVRTIPPVATIPDTTIPQARRYRYRYRTTQSTARVINQSHSAWYLIGRPPSTQSLQHDTDCITVHAEMRRRVHWGGEWAAKCLARHTAVHRYRYRVRV